MRASACRAPCASSRWRATTPGSATAGRRFSSTATAACAPWTGRSTPGAGWSTGSISRGISTIRSRRRSARSSASIPTAPMASCSRAAPSTSTARAPCSRPRCAYCPRGETPTWTAARSSACSATILAARRCSGCATASTPRRPTATSTTWPASSARARSPAFGRTTRKTRSISRRATPTTRSRRRRTPRAAN